MSIRIRKLNMWVNIKTNDCTKYEDHMLSGLKYIESNIQQKYKR